MRFLHPVNPSDVQAEKIALCAYDVAFLCDRLPDRVYVVTDRDSLSVCFDDDKARSKVFASFGSELHFLRGVYDQAQKLTHYELTFSARSERIV